MAMPETAVMEALGKAADDARRALALRFQRWYAPELEPGEALSRWADRCAAFEAALTAYAARLTLEEVIRGHQMLDYAKWRTGDDDLRGPFWSGP